MNSILISYDLRGREDSDAYRKLIERIKLYPGYTKPLESFWIVKTDSSASAVCGDLRPLIDGNDRLITIDVTNRSWWSYGLLQGVVDWLKKYM